MKTPRSHITPVLVNLAQKSGAPRKRLSREIAAYLLDENRIGELDSLLRDMVAYRATEGVVEITTVSAYELTDSTRRDIQKLVREYFPGVKQIIINQRTDTDVVGGVRLEFVDQQLDLTVRNKLNRFKELTTTERTAA